MRERPIPFSGPMVRAILDGSKMQTRRVVKWPATPDWHDWDYDPNLLREEKDGRMWPWTAHRDGFNRAIDRQLPCPYGAPGDRLWVKEAIRCFEWMDGGETSVEYVATPGELHEDAEWVWKRDSLPGMFMPRGLSRLTLTITDVRVERLQDISRGDAMAEGCPFPNMAHGDNPTSWYQDLWNEINAARGFGWDTNPWVWVISFARASQ